MLRQLDKKGDADAIADALQARKGSSKSKAWGTALAARYDANLAPRKAVEQYEQALSVDRDNAVIRCWMGESYVQLGEIDLAMRQWRQAFALMPSWAHPGVLLARAELKRGQTNQALEHAVDALRRAPNLVESAVIVAQASYQHLEQSFNTADAMKLIAFIQEIQRGAPGEAETLPILAELQARVGQRDDAIATIRNAIADKGAQPTTRRVDAAAKQSDPALIMALAEVSRRQNLGIEDEILAKLPTGAPNSPAVALQRAMDLARSGKKEEGYKLLTDAASPTVQWNVAKAEYLEATGDPRAKPMWISLGEENPTNVAVQNLILKEARSATADREFFARTIDRLHDLTGDDALGWKFARARFLLATSDDSEHRDKLPRPSPSCGSLVGESPDTPEISRSWLRRGPGQQWRRERRDRPSQSRRRARQRRRAADARPDQDAHGAESRG